MDFSPVTGADGRLYYTYNEGAQVKMRDENGEYLLEILACEYSNGKQYYQVAKNGIPMLGRMSINRLTYLLNRYQVMTLKLGAPVELPLTNEEVKIYADYKKRLLRAKKKQLEEKIEQSGYASLQREYNSVAGTQAIAECRGDAAAAEKLARRMEDLEKRMAEIEKDESLNLAILDREPCELCRGTGFIAGDESLGICRCMRKEESVIKTLCANWRK